MSKASPKTKANSSAKKATSSNEVIEISDSDDIEVDEVTQILFDSNSSSSSSSSSGNNKSGAKTAKKVNTDKEGASGSVAGTVATPKKRSLSATKKASAAGGGSGNGGVLYGDAFTVDEVMGGIRKLRKKQISNKAKNQSIADADSSSALYRKTGGGSVSGSGSIITTDIHTNLPSFGNIIEVKDLPSTEVVAKIEDVIVDVVSQIIENCNFDLAIPNRSANNQKYIEDIDRIVLGDKVTKRQFLNTSQCRKTAITTRVLSLVHEVLQKNIHITKRDLFYTDVKLFTDQTESDTVLDDVACLLGCTRTSLNVVASDKGLVVGRIQFQEAGDEIDCTRMGVGGKAIPPYIDKITNIRSDAEFVILVEKEAAYMRLAEDRFYNKYPCIIVTGKGQPDVATRLFLKKITDQLQIPVLALVDSDPYGLKILSVYMSGSKQMSYDSSHLTTSDIKWLGVRPSDLDRYNLPAQCRLKMTEQDKKMGEDLLKEPFIQKHPEWVKELELMLKTGEKAEIQALSSFGFQFITEEYLPRKLREADWI